MSSAENQLEVSIYVGNALSAILYGVNICMYFTTAHLLIKRRIPDRNWTIFYIGYGAILLLMLTIHGVMIQTFGQLLWITYRDVPGGPPVWLENHGHSWYGVLASAATTVSNTMGDGLMLRRCYIILQKSKRHLIFPTLLYGGVFVSSIVTTIKDASPQSNFWALTFLPWDVAWISCTAAFNATVTFMICYRIVATNWAARDILPAGVLRTHTGLVSMMVEGTIPFTFIGIAYAISEVTDNVSQICLSRVWMSFCVLSQQFIILRIAMGTAWSEETMAQVTLNMSMGIGE